MKLPKLSEPKTVVFKDVNSTIEITSASAFDLMSANQQWALILFGLGVFIVSLSMLTVYIFGGM